VGKKRNNEKNYGLFESFGVINDVFLAKIILKIAMKADLTVQKLRGGTDHRIHVSNFLKRSMIIKDIKKKVWISTRFAKK